MGTEATETEIDINEPGNPDTTFAESESQPDSILNGLEKPQANAAPESEYTNEKVAEDLNAKGEAGEGKEFIATPKAEEELVYKIDHRDYIVTVKNGIETPIESKDEAQLRLIVSELKSNGQYLRFDTVEELGDGKVEQGNEQSAEKIEAGTRFGTLYVLNRADMTYKMYTVKEVRKENEEQTSSEIVDDGDDDQKTAPASLFEIPKAEQSTPEPVVMPQVFPEPQTLAVQNEVAEPANESNENLSDPSVPDDLYDLLDPDDEVIPPPVTTAPVTIEPTVVEPVIATEEVIVESYDSNLDLYDLYDDDDVATFNVASETPAIALELKEDEPTITTNYPEVPEITELGNIDQNESRDNEEIEETNVFVNEEPVFYREEKFVVTEEAIVNSETQYIVESFDELNTEPETETVENVEPIQLIEITNQPEAIQEASIPEPEIAEADFQAETAITQQETETEPISLVTESEQEASEALDIVDETEESGIKVAETTQVAQNEATVIRERMEVRRDESETKSIVEPTKISEPTNIVVEPQIKLAPEKPAITIEKPDVKQAEPVKQILEKPVIKIEARPAIKVEQQPIKLQETRIQEKPATKLETRAKKIEEVKIEPIKIEKIEKPVTVTKPVIEARAPRVEATKVKVQEKIVDRLPELLPISIVTTAPDLAKASPTRNESKITINDRSQQFRNSSSPLKISVAKSSVKSEALTQTARQNGISKIIDDLEANNSYSPASVQRSGISIATIAR